MSVRYNLFLALAREKSGKVIREFVLWCVVCAAVIVSLIAAVLGKGNVTWIMLTIFSVGLAVLLAFRLKQIALLYSTAAFYIVTALIHFFCFSGREYYLGYSSVSYSIVNIILFIVSLVLGAAIMICAFVQFFSRYNLGKIVAVLVIIDFTAIVFLHILMYAAGYMGDFYANVALREGMNYYGYWIGTAAFWIILTIVMLLYIFLFWDFVDGPKKIIGGSSGRMPVSGGPGLFGINGVYAGKTFYLQGRTVTLGSGQGVSLIINARYVSRMHCIIRFNPSTGFYEIRDESENGVILSTGQRLQKGVYHAVKRGSVICIGSEMQQFRLL